MHRRIRQEDRDELIDQSPNGVRIASPGNGIHDAVTACRGGGR